MNETRWASRAAYSAAVLFVASLARFFFIPRLGLGADSLIVAELNGGLLPVAAHLILFPVVAALDAPPWARLWAMAGWLSTSRPISWPSRALPTRSICPCATAGIFPQPSGLWRPPGKQRARCGLSACSWRWSSAGTRSFHTGRSGF
jgi:hypothetical protein